MLKKSALLAALSIGVVANAHADFALVGHTMNYITNLPTAWHFVDFSEIKPEKRDASEYMLLTVVTKHAGIQLTTDGLSYLTSVVTSRHDCKYGLGAQVFHTKLYADFDMSAKALIYTTPKWTPLDGAMEAQWMHPEAGSPVIVGYPRGTYQDIACGRLQRNHFK